MTPNGKRTMRKTRLNPSQQLFKKYQYEKLLRNSKDPGEDYAPVVKFFDPWGAATWLLTECDEDGLAFGLCDLGFGCPEMGAVSMKEICSIGRIERDLHFKTSKPLSEWAAEARADGHIKA